ncbi:unnamed protein product, partial [Scytosiphon promiscuus]
YPTANNDLWTNCKEGPCTFFVQNHYIIIDKRWVLEGIFREGCRERGCEVRRDPRTFSLLEGRHKYSSSRRDGPAMTSDGGHSIMSMAFASGKARKRERRTLLGRDLDGIVDLYSG